MYQPITENFIFNRKQVSNFIADPYGKQMSKQPKSHTKHSTFANSPFDSFYLE